MIANNRWYERINGNFTRLGCFPRAAAIIFGVSSLLLVLGFQVTSS